MWLFPADKELWSATWSLCVSVSVSCCFTLLYHLSAFPAKVWYSTRPHAQYACTIRRSTAPTEGIWSNVVMLHMLDMFMTCLGVIEGCFEGPTYLSRVVELLAPTLTAPTQEHPAFAVATLRSYNPWGCVPTGVTSATLCPILPLIGDQRAGSFMA